MRSHKTSKKDANHNAPIDLYVGINDTTWNYHSVRPGMLACISPVYGASTKTKRENRVSIPVYTSVIEDSGAFCDGPGQRLPFPVALDRQLEHSQKYGYDGQVTHRASYDLLIDEMWTNGNRFKRRWSESDAWDAVRETVDAAAYMAKAYDGPRILSAQGVTPNQYLECSLRVLEYLNPATDIFGLGGWCISGKMPAIMREPFDETMALAIPLLARAGIKRVHIWGVMDADFLGPLLWLCDQHNLKLSTDSSGPQVRPARGVWGYKGWSNPSYKRPDESVRGLHRALHVIETRQWLRGFRQTEFYKPPVLQPKQLCLF